VSRYCVIYALVFLTSGAFAGVTVTAPHSGAVLGSPVNFAATATSTCSKGVASMGVYIDNQLTYVSNGTSLHTSLAFDPGPYHTVVEEWDYCGGASFTPIDITVADKTGVWVTSPSNNATVGSPVNYVATSHTTACSKGVASATANCRLSGVRCPRAPRFQGSADWPGNGTCNSSIWENRGPRGRLPTQKTPMHRVNSSCRYSLRSIFPVLSETDNKTIPLDK
jgi:Bacterial Ig domain